MNNSTIASARREANYGLRRGKCLQIGARATRMRLNGRRLDGADLRGGTLQKSVVQADSRGGARGCDPQILGDLTAGGSMSVRRDPREDGRCAIEARRQSCRGKSDPTCHARERDRGMMWRPCQGVDHAPRLAGDDDMGRACRRAAVVGASRATHKLVYAALAGGWGRATRCAITPASQHKSTWFQLVHGRSPCPT